MKGRGGKRGAAHAVQKVKMGFYPTNQWLEGLGFLLEVNDHCKMVW